MRSINRRTLAKGAAWSVPAAILTASVPAYAASTCQDECLDLKWFDFDNQVLGNAARLAPASASSVADTVATPAYSGKGFYYSTGNSAPPNGALTGGGYGGRTWAPSASDFDSGWYIYSGYYRVNDANNSVAVKDAYLDLNLQFTPSTCANPVSKTYMFTIAGISYWDTTRHFRDATEDTSMTLQAIGNPKEKGWHSFSGDTDRTSDSSSTYRDRIQVLNNGSVVTPIQTSNGVTVESSGAVLAPATMVEDIRSQGQATFVVTDPSTLTIRLSNAYDGVLSYNPDQTVYISAFQCI